MASSFTFDAAVTEAPLRCPRCGIFAQVEVKLEAMACYHAMGLVRACPRCSTAYICRQFENKRTPSSLPVMMYTITPLLIVCEQCATAVRIRWVDPEITHGEVLIWIECVALDHKGDQHMMATLNDRQLAHARAGGHALVTNSIRLFTPEEINGVGQECERLAEKWMHMSMLFQRFAKHRPPKPEEKF